MASSDSESRSGLVLELAEEFLDRYRAGERPPLKEYVERHPDLADEIREVFPAMAMMEKIALADETLEARTNGEAPIPQFDQLGDYRVLREVGRGGMGVVYEAEQVSLGRHVALKVLPPQSLKDARQRRRFEREAKAAAKLHHTNIVPVFGVGEQEEMPYYVMQFIQGQGLDAVLDELKRLRTRPRPNLARAAARIESTVAYEKNDRDVSAADVAQSLLTGRFGQNGDGSFIPNDPPEATVPSGSGSGSDLLSSSSLTLPSGASRGKSRRATYWEGVARIGQQVAEALAYAHGQGIIHRDVKPSNLLLDTRGTVWVADFGLAKASDQQDLTHTGDILGTLRYMPPEAFGGKADSRGDIYSLGLTLYELLAFRPAFDERDRGRLVKQVTNDVPPPLKKLNPEVPRDLETIVQKSIERDPNHRYQNAAELADDLRRFVEDEPIQARRASIAERVARWGRRNPAVASLLGAVTLLLLAIIASLWQADRQARRALAAQTSLRQEADEKAEEALRSAELERKAKAEALTEKQKAETANKALLETQGSLRSTLYAAQMNLTRVAFESGNASRTLDLLAAVVPKPGEPDLRGFEWSYWRRQVHGERTFRKFPGREARFDREDVFSPDGSLIARYVFIPGQSGSEKLLVFETTTGQLIQAFPLKTSGKGAESSAHVRAAFSSNNKVLAVHFSYPLVTQQLTELRKNVTKEVHVLAWNLSDQRELFHDSQVVETWAVWPCLGVNGDGSRLAVGTWLIDVDSNGNSAKTYRGSFRVVDFKEKREIIRIDSSDRGYVHTEFSPDGRLVAYRTLVGTGTLSLRGFGTGSRLKILEVETGLPRFDPEGIPSDGSGQIHFSPDGRRIATIGGLSFESTLSIFDVETEQLRVKESLSDSFVGTPEFTFSPDSRMLYIPARTSSTAQVRDVETGRMIQALNLGIAGTQRLVVRHSDGRLLSSRDDDLREWDLAAARPTSLDGGLILTDLGGGYADSNMRFLAFAQGGHQLLVYRSSEERESRPDEFFSHDVVTGQILRNFPSRESESEPKKSLYWLQPDKMGTRLAAVIGNPSNVKQEELRVRIWDLVASRVLLTLNRERLGGVPSTVVNLSSQAWDETGTFLALGIRGADPGPDGKTILRADHFVAIVEIPSGRVVRRISTGTELPVVSFRPDGKLLAIGTTEAAANGRVTKVELVDPTSGRIVQRLSGDLATLGRLIFTPDGRRLAASTLGNRGRGRILIWDLTAGDGAQPVQIQDRGEMPYILAFSPDGRRLATGTYSSYTTFAGEVKLWDSASGNDLATWPIAKGPVQDLAFDQTGRQLRVVSLKRSGTNNAGLTLLDASPLAPEIEADDLISRLGPQFPLNAELITKLQADADLDPAIRAEALKMAPLRFESSNDLRSKAATWLDLPATERTPDLMRRALLHANQAVRLMDSPTSPALCVQAEARYRNGLFAEALEAIREARNKLDEATANDRDLRFRVEAILALTEAKLGHGAEAEAALANARKLWAEANPSATSPSPLLVEAEGVVHGERGQTAEKK